MGSFSQNIRMQEIMPELMGDGIPLTIRAVMSVHANDSLIVFDENHTGQFVVEWFVTNSYPVYLGNTFDPHRVSAHRGIPENLRGVRFTAAPVEPDPSRHHLKA